MINTKYTTISAAEANRRGDVPITTGYLEHEYDLLDRAIETLDTKRFVLVHTNEGIMIARPGTEVVK